MAKLGTDEKRMFVVASGVPQRAEAFSRLIGKHIGNSIVYTATDGIEALFKMENTPPHVLLLDMNLPKSNAIEVATKVLHHSKLQDTSIIIVSDIPDQEHFVDQVVTCQVQFFTDVQDEVLFSTCLTKALNRLADDRSVAYRLRFLAPGEILFKEGEEANSVFIVKRGELQAYKGSDSSLKILGNILMGEFVGEMAHINGDPRSATVRALADCELIEIPIGTLDTVLFTKPAWSKALVATLSRRLKRSNEKL